MQEMWKDILGYEGLYQISSIGRVKSLPRINKNRVIQQEIYKKPSRLPKGYLRIGLCKNGKTTYYAIHRLVAEAFIPNPENKPCVNHKDCNTSNNNKENLEWVTYEENNNFKNHNLKRNISSVIYLLKKDYPNEKQLIEIAEQLKNNILKL